MQHLLSRATRIASLASILALCASASVFAADPRTTPDRGAGSSQPDTRGYSGGACFKEFTDSAGETWDIHEEGAVSDGTEDAYDWYGELYLTDGTEDGSWAYFDNEEEVCSLEEDGRELVLGPNRVTLETGGLDRGETAPEIGSELEVTRKVYVPAEGQAFARWVDIIRNPGTEPVTFQYDWYGEYGEIADGDEGVETILTFDGDNVFEIGEPWGAFRHDYDGSSHVASLYDGVGGNGWDRPYDEDGYYSVPGKDGSDYVDFVYDPITLAAGQSATFMHVEHQNTSPGEQYEVRGTDEYHADNTARFEETAAFARSNERGNAELFAGMDDAELGTLQNWLPDGDGDDVLDGSDNCDTTANTDQADLDADGEGDACDTDVDGDGLTNAQEARMGMDARNANTDGDGLADGVDRCPTRAGTEFDGCPSATTVTTITGNSRSAAVRRLRAQRLTSTVDRRRTKRSLRLTTSGELKLPAGITRAQGCKGTVTVTVKSGRYTVSSRKAKLSRTCTYSSKVTFSPADRLAGRSLKVKATFQGNSRLFRQRAKGVTVGQA